MNIETGRLYRNGECFYQLLEHILENGKLISSDMNEGRNSYMVKTVVFHVYENLDLGVYSYIDMEI